MKKTEIVAALRARGIVNAHGLLSEFGEPKKDVAISYRANGGRSVLPPMSSVWSPTFATRADAPWYDGGAMTFTGSKFKSQPLAKAWALEKFGIAEWTPFEGDLVPATAFARAVASLKAAS